MGRHFEPGNADRGRTDPARLEELVDRARTDLRDWTDWNAHDPGVTMLELFAYVAELLGTYSESVAAEAHLGDGRRRWQAPPRENVARQGAHHDAVEGAVGVADHVEVAVDAEPWQQVADLANSRAEDRHYVVNRRDGTSVVEFGDGVHGRRPSSDSSIGVRYRRARTYASVLLQEGRVTIDADVHEDPSPADGGVYRATVLDNADPLAQQRLLVRIPDLGAAEERWAAACLPAGGSHELPAVDDDVWVALEAGDAARPVWLGTCVTH